MLSRKYTVIKESMLSQKIHVLLHAVKKSVNLFLEQILEFRKPETIFCTVLLLSCVCTNFGLNVSMICSRFKFTVFFTA